MNAVSLARQSRQRDDQDESVSLAFQHKICAEEAGRRGDEIVREFSDLDVPGDQRSSRRRTGLHEMVAYLKTSPHIRRVYVYNVSRLARETYFVLDLVRALRSIDVELRSASENIEDPTILTIISAMAERERIQLSNNVAYAVREQASRGIVTQAPPFGYRRERGILVPNENAPTVQRIFREFVAGRSTFDIAAGLLHDGIPSPHGLPGWRSRTIRRMIARRTYRGEIEISESRDPAGRTRPHLITKGLHEPIVDPETWDAANRILTSRQWTRRKDGRILPWLSAIAHCSECGRRVYFGVKSRRAPEDRWYAKCSTAQLASDNRTESTCTGQQSCELPLIERAARLALWDRLQQVQEAEPAYRRALQQTSKATDQTRRQLERRLDRHTKRLDQYRIMRADREMTRDEYARAKAEEEQTIEAIEQELATLPGPPSLVAYQAAHRVIEGAAATIPTASDDELRELVNTLGAKVFLDLRRKRATWTFSDPYQSLLR